MLEPFADSRREPLLPPAAPATPPAASPVTLTLPFKPPYDWDALIGFLGPRAIPGVECVRSGAYFRTIAVDGVQGWISVRPAESPGALLATVQLPRPEALPLIVTRIRHLFDLDADPARIAEKLSADPIMAPLLAARPGLRVPGAWDAFELAVRAILGQQVSVARATALAGKLVALAGTALPRPAGAPCDGLTHLFPQPSAVAGIADLEIPLGAALGMPRARAASIIALAEAVRADPQVLAPAETLDRSVARLCALPGIGEWTAQYIAMRALHWPDAFPHSDIGLIRALHTGERRPTPEEVLARARAWRPWRAYAALHLWFSDSAAARAIAPRDCAAGERCRMILFLDRLSSPIGTLLLVGCADALLVLEFEDAADRLRQALGRLCPDSRLVPGPVANGAGRRIAAYFEGDLTALDAIAVQPRGTEFQRRVWQALRRIPPGTTMTYGRLAAAIGKPAASRAVGHANGANPISIVIPCHRLIGADKSLTGYGGGLDRKAWLLRHESATSAPPSFRSSP